MLEPLLLLGCCTGLHQDSSVFRLHVSKAEPMWQLTRVCHSRRPGSMCPVPHVGGPV